MSGAAALLRWNFQRMSSVNSAAPSPWILPIRHKTSLIMLRSVRTALDDVCAIAKHRRSLYITSNVRKNSAQLVMHRIQRMHAHFGAHKGSGVRRTILIFLVWHHPKSAPHQAAPRQSHTSRDSSAPTRSRRHRPYFAVRYPVLKMWQVLLRSSQGRSGRQGQKLGPL